MYGRLSVLALGTFAIGTDSFVVAGILPQVATSLDVSVEAAGQLVTVFALSYAVLSPVMAAVTAHWPRRRVLLGGLAVLVVGALAGLGAAMFTPTASGVAASLVPPAQRGRALALVMAGLSGATALGAPIGTVIGSSRDWRTTMWFVAALAAVAFVGVAALLPTVATPPAVTLAQRLAPARDARIALTLLTTVLVLTGLYTVYTYISVSYDRATGGDGTRLAGLLFAFGLAATIGNLVSGALTDRFGNRRIINAAVAIAAVDFALMPWSSAALPTAVLAIVVWGLCGWGVLVPQQHRLIQIAGAGAPLAIALNAAAIYLAVSVSGLTGALGITLVGAHHLGLVGSLFIGLGLVAAEQAWARLRRTEAGDAEAA